MMRFKYILTMLLLIVFASMCLADETKKKPSVIVEEDEFKKVEVGFFFGPAYPQFDFRNSISDSYSSHWYDVSYVTYTFVEYDFDASFSSSIAGKSERGIGFGGFFNYFFHKNFGFQFMLERSSHDVPIYASHSVSMPNVLYSYGGESLTAYPPINDTTGNLPVMPISFNVIARFNGGKNISGYASGGLTYYKADIEAKSNVGDGFPYLLYMYDVDLDFLLYDSVLVPVSIDESIGGPGGNVGGGIVFTIRKNLGIVADVRYYLGPTKDVDWTLSPGDYTLSINDDYYLAYDQSDINDFLEEHGENLRVGVSTSFFRLAFGLKFSF